MKYYQDDDDHNESELNFHLGWMVAVVIVIIVVVFLVGCWAISLFV